MSTCIAALFLASVILLLFERGEYSKETVDSISCYAEMIGDNCRAALAFEDAEDARETLKSLQAEFGLSRTSISTVFSMYMLLSALFVIVGGWALDRYGEKKVFLLAGFFVSLSLMLTSRITASWQLYVTYSFLFAVGTSSVYVNSMSTVSRWFPDKKVVLFNTLANQ